jgi:hypothetical protein
MSAAPLGENELTRLYKHIIEFQHVDEGVGDAVQEVCDTVSQACVRSITTTLLGKDGKRSHYLEVKAAIMIVNTLTNDLIAEMKKWKCKKGEP